MAGVASAEEAKEQVKARADLLEIVRERVQLRRVGRQWTGLCPFHSEDTASFRVTPEDGFWVCFGCGRKGDVFTFVELIENTDFKGALELLAERTGVELVRQSPEDRRRSEARARVLEVNRVAQRFYEYLLWEHEAGRPGRELLERRGVSQEVARRFGLGYAPAGGRALTEYLRSRKLLAEGASARLTQGSGDFFRERLIVPIRDERAQVVAFVGRTAGADPRKYVNSPETPAYHKGRVLFGLDVARDGIGRRRRAVLMEGQFDVIVAHQFGVDHAVASSGTALTEDQLRLLRRFTEEVVFCFDNDEAGRKSALRAVELASLLGLHCRVVGLGGDAKDPDEFLRAGGDFEAAEAQALPGWDWYIRQAMEGLNPTRPAELATAIERIFEVLDKVPDAAVQEAYRLKSADWLGIEARLMVRPAIGQRRSRSSSAREGAAPAAAGAAPTPAPAAARRSRRPFDHLVAVLAAQPELAEPLARRLPVEDLQAGDRELYSRMSGILRARGREALLEALGDLDDHGQQLIRAAWADPPPPVGEDDLDDLVYAVRLDSLRAARQSAFSRLAEAEQRGDRDHTAAFTVEVGRLDRELQAMKNAKKGKSIVG